MEARKFKEIAFLAITIVNAILCLVSFWTSKLGLDTVVDSQLISVGVTLGGAAFLFVFWFILSRRYPEANAKKKGQILLLIALLTPLIFGFSTLWTIITAGGKEAVGVHMQTVLEKVDAQGIAHLKRGSYEANLAPQFESLETQFLGLAEREAKAAFSGMRGEGDVTATLRNTAQTFRGLAESVRQTQTERQKLYDELKAKTAAARRLLTDKEQSLADINIKFSSLLADINELLTKMSETSSMKYVISVSGNLTNLAVVVSGNTSQVQREAIARLTKVISGAQDVVRQIAAQAEQVDVKVETFTMISMGNAVVKYASEISYAWAYGIAIDFAPFFFILLLSLTRVEEEKDMTLDEARAMLANAQTAAEAILDDARKQIRDIIQELKPEIVHIADTARVSLEAQTDRIVTQVKDTVATGKVQLEQTYQLASQKLGEIRFKI